MKRVLYVADPNHIYGPLFWAANKILLGCKSIHDEEFWDVRAMTITELKNRINRIE